MLNEKIVYYRKKNLMTQEELAQQLCVSRQTITKWESGLIYPSLEYLIDLSNLFHVPIDSLVKDDEYEKKEETFNKSALALFLVISQFEIFYLISDNRIITFTIKFSHNILKILKLNYILNFK